MKTFVLGLLACMVAVAAPWAQGGAADEEAAASAYNANFGGLVNYLPPLSSFKTPFTPGTPNALEQQSIQGAGGFGYNDYAAALFNLGQVFDQFESRDLSSDLAVRLMTYNMVMPQTAALFQQMNTFGNERYQQFLMAYPLSAQQQDAKNQYLQECMAKYRQAFSMIGGSADAVAQYNARGAEMCLQRYTAEARTIQTQSNQSYSEFLRQSQDVNAMINPLLCPEMAEGDVCWPNLLLPQVRICTSDQLASDGRLADCDANNFGVQSAPLPMKSLFDIFVLALGKDLQDRMITPFRSAISTIPHASLVLAAQKIEENLKDVAPVSATAAPFADVVGPLQRDFLGCSDPDMSRTLRAFGQGVYELVYAGAEGSGGTGRRGETTGESLRDGLIPPTPGFTLFTAQLRKVLQPYTDGGGAATSADTMAKAMYIASGCAVSMEVPFLDPLTVANMPSSGCSASDQDSYFDLAAFDVAVVATRNMLLYTKQKLEVVLGRLESEDPTSLKYAPAGGASRTIDSPAARKRLAMAVKTIMLPQVENDLRRIEAINQNPGRLRLRNQAIYKSGKGCLSASRGSGNAQ